MLALLIALASPTLSERTAIFKSAGFHRVGKQWQSDCDNLGTPSYTPGAIKTYRDLNGDGRPEAIVTEGSAVCYGNTGTAFTLLTRASSGAWVKLYQSPGMPHILASRANGWPEIEVGVPDLCTPILRWTGKAYAIHRRHPAGKPCAR